MAQTDADTKFLRLKWRRAFDRWERKAARWVDTIKAGFDPNQPRVPAGNPDGGQWTRTGGASGGSSGTSAAAAAGGASSKDPKGPNRPKKRLRSPKRRPSPVKKLDVPVNRPLAKARAPLEPAPRVTKRKPPTTKLENRAAKQVGKWLLKAAARRALGPIGIALDVIDGALWLHKHYPDIQSYFDDPKPLKELQDAVSDPLVGYEVHHIVERGMVEKDGIGTDLVDLPENLVRIPTWKHHEITAWYMTKNKRYGNLPPREYLRGKSWEEKYKVGIKALKETGVLK